MRLRVLSAILVFLIGSIAPVWAQSGNACYSREDCECLFSDKGLRDGRWQAVAAAGSFVSSEGYVTVMNADEIDLEVVSHCDGQLEISWNDREAGPVTWQLFRTSKGTALPGSEASYYQEISPDVWMNFSNQSSELEEFAQDNEIYLGQTTYTIQGVSMPATMLFAYSGLPGRHNERGWASMTVQMGPFAGRSFWGRTGKVDLFWVSETDTLVKRRREVCRCDDVESTLASYDLSIKLQSKLLNDTTNLEKRRSGYRATLDTLMRSSTGSFNEMHNERFDPSAPIVSPTAGSQGNHPCLQPSQIQDQIITDQEKYKVDFNKAWGKILDQNEATDRRIKGEEPLQPELEGKPGKGRTGAYVDWNTCEIHVIEDPIDPQNPEACGRNEAILESYIAHENVHRETCQKQSDAANLLKDQIEATANGLEGYPGLSPEAAATLRTQRPWECLAYKQYMTNSYNAALDELIAYKAGQDVLKRFHGQYCSF